ncbi:MAG: aminodeoxychorismate/anthranilate synthase component II [Lentisphaeria bacterium]|nr:aminodeoxychorismate/anthranilate synthase component II [Lentisphaeria bacterium]NQZ67648.1 aminodeoxychorismate/anthranilate synthase component II [Lentisphaeria bacterium]
MIIMIDNYDSFTYNLVQEMGKLGAEMDVFRNDKITVDELAEKNPTALIISPGPCSPDQAGISVEAIQHFSGKIPVLGVCLGHQSIIRAFGGTIIHAKTIMHGKTSPVTHQNTGMFKDLPSPFEVGRYHSLVGEQDSMPDCLHITAESDDGEIMGVQHKEHCTHGIQFHPESVLTPDGMAVMKNFLDLL